MSKITAKYPDHIFGDVEKPPRNLRYHARRVLGVHHWDQTCWDPDVSPGSLTVYATTHSRLSVKSVHLLWTRDDWQSQSQVDFAAVGQEWDDLTWGWVFFWRAELPVSAGDLLRYKIFARLADGREVFADNQSEAGEQATQFAQWLNPANRTPAWAEHARVYQVFVDRFNPGKGREWLQTKDLMQPFGGTLRGVTEKLDTLLDLGFNCLWLSPIFRSPSHHGYDISDYFEIEPRFGGKRDLEELICQAHQRGMRILLDFVANHCSSQHESFLAAQGSKADPRYAWFNWKRWPKTYESFYDVPTMPRLNLHFGSPARQHLLEAAQFWLKMGVDGYRLDYANGPDRDFWVDFQRACLEINPDCWTFGEVVAPADEQAQFFGSMHGTLDFLTCQILREAFALRTRSVSELAGYLCASETGFPADFSRPVFIDNHDMNRFIFAAQGNFESLVAALTLLYLLPQPPIVYYGTEKGLSQNHSIHDRGSHGFDEARLAMPWEENRRSRSLADLMRTLSAFRAANPWLTEASWELLSTSGDGAEARIRLGSGTRELTVKIVVRDEVCAVTRE